MQKLNFQRALQGELTRTIKTLDAVAQVRVHLVIPKDNLFRKDKPKGKASITLKVKSGKTLKCICTFCSFTAFKVSSTLLVIPIKKPATLKDIYFNIRLTTGKP